MLFTRCAFIVIAYFILLIKQKIYYIISFNGGMKPDYQSRIKTHRRKKEGNTGDVFRQKTEKTSFPNIFCFGFVLNRKIETRMFTLGRKLIFHNRFR